VYSSIQGQKRVVQKEMELSVERYFAALCDAVVNLDFEGAAKAAKEAMADQRAGKVRPTSDAAAD
jgi:hypothetical protein